MGLFQPTISWVMMLPVSDSGLHNTTVAWLPLLVVMQPSEHEVDIFVS